VYLNAVNSRKEKQ